MLAEGVHSVADTGNQGLLLLGGRQARRAPDEEHPFGFARERYFYGFVVAMVLFSLGSLFALYEGWRKVTHPHDLETPAVAIGILVFALVLEAVSFRTAIREARHVRGDASWVGFVRRSKAPELPVVLLEDLAALIGLLFALAGVVVATVTGNSRWDGAGSLAIGVLLGAVATVLAVEMKSLLVGEGADPDVVRRITEALPDGTHILGVIHLRTMHLGPEELLVAAKLAVAEGSTTAELATAIDAAEERVRAQVPIARPMYLEPDLRRS
jgi:cation diffusion facilitator family transporter